MTTEQKIIRAKVGLLELAKQLGNVSQACKMMGYSRDSFYRTSSDLRLARAREIQP
jgi:Winged helix-turn helix